jgi:hypothetical protein
MRNAATAPADRGALSEPIAGISFIGGDQSAIDPVVRQLREGGAEGGRRPWPTVPNPAAQR